MRCRLAGDVEVCAGDPTCRDTRTGRFVACPVEHGEPVGSAVGPDGVLYCRDARGREWLSRGECD